MTFRSSIRVAVAVALAGVVGFVAGAQDDDVRTLEVNQVARVGERVITAEEFIQRLVERERQYQDPDMRTASWALDSLVADHLVELEAERIGASPKRREVDQKKEEMKRPLERELEIRNEEIVRIQKANGEEPNPYTWEEWLKLRYDTTPERLDRTLARRAVTELKQHFVVHDWQVRTGSALAQGIFARSRRALTQARERLDRGEKFSEVAGEVSQDMWTRRHDGEIGWARPGDGSFESEVEERFWDLEVGEVSDIIEVEHGFWIVRRAENRLANEADFHDLRDEIMKKKSPSPGEVRKWRSAIANSGRYAYERRMPGWDTQADTQ